MIGNSLENISKKDIQYLVENNVMERKGLDYKAKLPGGNDSARKEFLADVSSFANTVGGDLVFGISEKGGALQVDMGVSTSNPDQEIARMENMLRDGISPRVSAEIRAIVLDSGKYVFVLRTQPSQLAPHRVVFCGHDKFYKRNSNGKYPMDVGELRAAFLQFSDVIERIKEFRGKRIRDIRNLDTPTPISNYSTFLALHIVPLSAMNSGTRIQGKVLNQLRVGNHVNLFRPMTVGSGWSPLINLEGIAVYTPYSGEKVSGSYMQLYSDGKIEAVDEVVIHPHAEGEPQLVAMRHIEAYTLEYSGKMLELLKTLSFQPPFYMFLTIAGVGGATVSAQNGRFHGIHPIRQPDLLLPELIIENWSDNLATKFRPIFDMVWNASGVSESPYYDNDGNHTIRTH